MAFEFLIHSDTFDGDTTFADSSGNSHPISPLNSPSHQDTESYWGATSMDLQGVSQALYCPNFAWGSQDFTLDFWIWRVVIANTHTFAHRDGDTAAQIGIRLYCTSSGTAWISMNTDGTSASGSFSLLTYMPAGQWVHFAMVRSGSLAKCYCDGVQVFSAAITGNINAMTGPFMIAGAKNAAEATSNGYLDEFSIRFGEAIDFSVTGVPTWPYLTEAPAETGDGAGDISSMTGAADGFTSTLGTASGDISETTGFATNVISGQGTGTISEIDGYADNIVEGIGTGNISEIVGLASTVEGLGAGNISSLEGSCTALLTHYGAASGSIESIIGAAKAGGRGEGAISQITGVATGGVERLAIGAGSLESITGESLGSVTIVGSAAGRISAIHGSASIVSTIRGSARGNIPLLTGTSKTISGLNFNIAKGNIFPIKGKTESSEPARSYDLLRYGGRYP